LEITYPTEQTIRMHDSSRARRLIVIVDERGVGGYVGSLLAARVSTRCDLLGRAAIHTKDGYTYVPIALLLWKDRDLLPREDRRTVQDYLRIALPSRRASASPYAAARYGESLTGRPH
jgi:hypothetical protein